MSPDHHRKRQALVCGLLLLLASCSPPPPVVSAPPQPALPLENTAEEDDFGLLGEREFALRMALAKALMRAAEWQAAKEHLQRIRHTTQNWVVHLDYAYVLYRLGAPFADIDLALRQVIRFHPENPRAQVLYGQLHEDADNLIEAEHHYRQAVSIHADRDATASMALARVLSALDRPREAIEVLQRHLALSQPSARLLLQLAHAQELAADLDAAHRTFRLAADLHSDPILGLNRLLHFYRRHEWQAQARAVEAQIAALQRKRSVVRNLRALLPSPR